MSPTALLLEPSSPRDGETALPIVDSTARTPPRSAPAPLAVAAVALPLAMSSPQVVPEVLWAGLFPQSSSVRPTSADPSPWHARALPSSGEQLALVQQMFALNKTQLAEACLVQRQTIYDWYAAKFEAEGDNARRLGTLYRLARSFKERGHPPLAPKAAERQLENDGSLLDLLRASHVDAQRIRHAAVQLRAVMPPPTATSAREQRERLGWRPRSEQQRADQLASNLDDILGE